ncbi:hypothetical protein HK100_000940 [Physocladia obscura]|uniref:Ricin B lectin domain-containing protein n=1 Tax=Physocladia obscura TaxID=109957 RepID=A0AAD5SXR2_9FUNG|nr:hypothetical protein HK100_000940 [Physocladia obscura]
MVETVAKPLDFEITSPSTNNEFYKRVPSTLTTEISKSRILNSKVSKTVGCTHLASNDPKLENLDLTVPYIVPLSLEVITSTKIAGIETIRATTANMKTGKLHSLELFHMQTSANSVLNSFSTTYADESMWPISVSKPATATAVAEQIQYAPLMLNYFPNVTVTTKSSVVTVGTKLVTINSENTNTYFGLDKASKMHLYSAPNLCMSVAGGVMHRGIWIVLDTCESDSVILWNMTRNVAGTVYRPSKNIEFCLDDNNGGLEEGNKVQLWNCNGGWNQKWVFGNS